MPAFGRNASGLSCGSGRRLFDQRPLCLALRSFTAREQVRSHPCFRAFASQLVFPHLTGRSSANASYPGAIPERGASIRASNWFRSALKYPHHFGGGPIGSGPPMPAAPCGEGGAALVPGRYQGLARHSASVPEAEAWQVAMLLKEQPLQPGLSTPWMQKGYCDMPVWAEAGT
jgi:hypothetical protein